MNPTACLLRYVLPLVLVTGCGVESAPPRAGNGPLASVSSEELAVYTAVLDSLYRQDERVDTVLIHRETSELLSAFEDQPSTDLVRQRLRMLAAAPADAIEDYLRANSAQAAISEPLPIQRPNRISGPVGDGPVPNASAPHSFTFSRVGFSAARDFAIVTVAFHCPVCGEGQSVLLARSGTGWRVVEASVNWVS